MDIEETVLILKIQNILASLMKKVYKNRRILINIKIVSKAKVSKDTKEPIHMPLPKTFRFLHFTAIISF